MPLVAASTSTSLGRKSVVILTATPAASTGIPILAEANAGIFGSMHIYGDFGVTPNQNTGEGPRPLGSKFVPTRLGQVTYPATDVQYSYKPQALATSGGAGNEVYEALVPGSVRTVLVLNDIAGDKKPLEAGDVANIYLLRCGEYREGQTGEGEFDIFAVTQSLTLEGGAPVAKNVALSAS